MEKVTKMSITEYSKIRKISRQASWKAVKKGNAPGVVSFEKIGNFILLYVDSAFIREKKIK